MRRKFQIALLILSISVSKSSDAATKLDPAKVCLQPEDGGHCFTGLRRMWYYNFRLHICLEFLYGGCGGNNNRFATEEECYAVCKERLVFLHPPQDVQVGYTQHDKIFIYWYRPENYQLHDDNEMTAGIPATELVATVTKSKESSTMPTGNTNNTGVTAPPTKTPATEMSTNLTNGTGEKENSSNLAGHNLQNGGGNLTNKMENKGSDNSSVDGDNVSLEGGVNLHIVDYIGKNPVPFHFSKLTHYMLSYKIHDGEYISRKVPSTATEYRIEGLEPSTKYVILLKAVYMTNTSVAAQPIEVNTRKDPTAPKECHCDEYGTEGGHQTCNLTNSKFPLCRCMVGYSGLFCEVCDRGFYRLTRSLPCHRCPCEWHASTGSCHFVDSYLHCTQCKQEYAGQRCHRCGNGYYRDVSTGHCKKCEGCHNILPGLICEPFTGKCLNCHYNTTGYSCDRCLEGFEGDPLKNISCVPVQAKKIYTPPPTGLIVAVVVGVIVLLSLIIGCIVYNRMRSYPAMKPFWTVELKQDHDGVNFSSVPDRDFDTYHDEDQYSDRQSKKNKSQPYSQLKEEI